MKISVFQAVLLGAFGLLAVVGLVVFATYSGGSGKSSIGPVTVWGPFPKDAMAEALSTLANGNDDLKSVTYVEVRPDTLEDDYINAVAAGKGPDLILISQEDLGRLRPTLAPIPYSSITERQFKDAFADGASVFMAADGIYGVPIAIDPLVMYFNKTMLASAGIAAPPATWEAVAGLVPKVTQVSGQAVANPLIALGTYANVHGARGILSALFLQAGVPIASAGQGGVPSVSLVGQSSSGESAGAAVVRFYTSFANPAQPNYDWNASFADSRQQFVAGKLALYLGYASELSYLKQANPNLVFDVAKLPQPGTATARASYARFYAFAIPRTAANPSGAFSAAVALTSDAGDSALVKAAGTLAPAKRSLLGADTEDPYAAVFNGEALIAKGWLSPAPLQTDQAFGAMITSVITGASSVTDALSAAERAIRAALQ
jgi:ABC-type glycerol-3-phosphate transport system substrate-binding protein